MSTWGGQSTPYSLSARPARKTLGLLVCLRPSSAHRVDHRAKAQV